MSLSLVACAAGQDLTAAAGSGGGTSSAGSGSGGGGGLDITTGSGGASVVCKQWVVENYEAGADGKLGTPDDQLTGTRSVEEIGKNGVISEGTSFLGPGPDGQWDTADDVIGSRSYVVAAPGGAVFYATATAPGPDGQWKTSDDVVSGAGWARLDGQGRPVETRSFGGPGADMQWMTADDPVTGLHAITYGDGKSAPSVLDLEILSPGADQKWGTSDDPISSAARRYPDWGAFSSGPGNDGMWGTDDDPVSGRYEDKRNWTGFLQWAPSYMPGGDGTFFTPDDEIVFIGIVTCSNATRDARLISYPGPDGAWGTADDVVQARVRYTGCDDICTANEPTTPLEPPK